MQENKRQKNKNTFKFITRKLIYLNFLLYFILNIFYSLSESSSEGLHILGWYLT